MKIKFNAPVILLFSILSAAVLGLNIATGGSLVNYFSVGNRFDFNSITDFFTIFSHVLGHAGTEHLIGNLSFILLLGPIIEEKYGSRNTFFMILFTAIVTGVLNIVLFDTGLMGASGIVFMLIILVSITNVKSGEIPLTFILVAILFIGKELWHGFNSDNISQFAHIMGGICGSIFGFNFLSHD